MSYDYITISAKIVPLTEILSQNFAERIFREKQLAEKAPQMLEALKKVQKALLFSRPVEPCGPEAIEAHKAAHQAVCDILLDFHEL